MLRWTFRILVGVFALFGVLVAATAAWLWLSARPVLEEARAAYGRVPAEARCQSAGARPPGYPGDWLHQIESLRSAEREVYLAACRQVYSLDSCVWMRGASRSLGFTTYRGLYLNDCELRAVSLHGETSLRRSLELLYADRPVAGLGEQEMICVARAMRSSHGGFCHRYPECCPAAAQEAAP